MKILLTSILSAALAAVSLYALADTDFSRIKQDVNVMSKILKGAFDSNRKMARGINIEGNYLASQGAVFTVNAPPALGAFSFRINDDDNEHEFMIYSNDMNVAPVAPVAPVAGIGDVSESIDFALQSLENIDWEAELAGVPGLHFEFDGSNSMDREVRSAMRELARSMREVEREISENRIEMIHVDEASERAELEDEIARLEEQRSEYEAKLEKLETELSAERQKMAERRAEMKEKALIARKEQMEMLEQTILQSLCDYGSTLKNLPDKEHVSVIIRRILAEGQQQIYVFDKEDVTECRSDAKGLKSQATAYLF